MTISATWRTLLKRTFLVLIGILTVTMVTLSFVQLWVLYTAKNVTAYGAVEANDKGWPKGDRRGAFLMLNQTHNPKYPSNLVELLATTDPWVVDEAAGAHVTPAELNSLLVQSAIVSEGGEYRVYRNGDSEQIPTNAIRQRGGKVMIIEPKDGVWKPGVYLVDIPSEGMFGGRTYFQFYVDSGDQSTPETSRP
jgi:hypothetical protein